MGPCHAVANSYYQRFTAVFAGDFTKVRHPELKLKIPAWVFCMSWCADFEFRVTQGPVEVSGSWAVGVPGGSPTALGDSPQCLENGTASPCAPDGAAASTIRGD